MKKYITVHYDKCTGCEACMNICGANAISMEVHENGFLYPNVNEKKCVKCAKCTQVCGCLSVRKEEKREVQKCYAAWADDLIREKSSSGGVFSVLAEYILELGGSVCGAAFIHSDEARHIIIHTKEELKAIRTSKYVQSRIGTIYEDIRRLLSGGKAVLFSGTPCQTDGLTRYLGGVPENLYIIDLLCHGVPSQTMFKKYLDEEFSNETIKSINFRDKSKGWTYLLNLKITTEKNNYLSNINESSYYRAFNERLSLRPCCGTCNYTTVNRCGDITLGDFWEIWNYDRLLDDRKGTSLVLVNTPKGEALFCRIKECLQKAQEVPISQAIKANRVLEAPIPLNSHSDEFLQYALILCRRVY